jgi:hypothetical protein
MKLTSNLILLATLLLCRNFLFAQNLTVYNTQDAGATWFNYSCTGPDAIWPGCLNKESLVKVEYPPWIIGGGWRTYFLVDGKGTTVASAPQSMLTTSNIDFHTSGGDPERVTYRSGCPGGVFWKLNYYCAYSAQYINHPTAGTVSLAFVEGENHTQVGAGHAPVDCDYVEWDGHSTYLCGAWIENTAATNWGQVNFSNEMGPIIWPSTGYFLADGTKTSGGCSNNATIQADDGYLYVFYKDNSYDGASSEAGRQAGIKVARAPISDALNPHAYQSFFEDASGVGHWNPSLPAGLTKDNIGSYLNGAMGPQATNILALPNEGGRDYTRFAVAKVAGTTYYLGVGSYQENGNLVMTLKYSYDLVHWSGEKEIDRATSWATSDFSYPIFLSNDGWSNTYIAGNDFYILGTRSEPIGNSVYRMRVYVPDPPPPPPPDPEPGPGTGCIDQWNNPIPCPICYQNGQPVDCGDHGRKATNGAVAALDNSKERAPFVSPNPGPGVFQVKYTLKDPAKTQLKVLDLMGRQIQTGAVMNRTAGTYTETVNISGHAKGVYLLELLVNGGKQTFKVIYQ